MIPSVWGCHKHWKRITAGSLCSFHRAVGTHNGSAFEMQLNCMHALLRILVGSSTTPSGLPFLIPISKRGRMLRCQCKFRGRTVPHNLGVKEQLPFHVRSALLTTRVPVTYNVENVKLMLITDLMIIPDSSC